MERLCKLKSPQSVSQALQNRSQSLETIECLYSDILEKLQEEDPVAYKTATKTFSWLLCMQEPLSCVAIIEAVSADNHDLKPLELLAICSNLIVFDTELDTLRFAHVSFKEFLQMKPGFDNPSVHAIAASACLETCTNCLPIDIEDPPQLAKNYTLYAAMYWARHYVSSALTDNKLLKEFVFSNDGLSFQLWLEAANKVSEALPKEHVLKKELNAVMSDKLTPFFTACIYGLKDIFSMLVESPDFDVDSKNLLNHTGLYLAAAFGHADIVQKVLDLGGDLSVSSGKYGDPLAAASAKGSVSVVELLLGQKGHYGSSSAIEPALRIAFLSGHEKIANIILATYLQSSDHDPNKTDSSWLLEAAAQGGFIEATESLTKNLLTRQSNERIVNAAIKKGQVALIKRYIDKDYLPADVVATAALFGKTDITTMCLDKGYSIETEGQFGTPLRCASLMGHEAAVRILLARGADVNATSDLGDALQVAAMKGYLSITQHLIQSGADVNNRGGFFGNALQAAAYRGHRDIAEGLLDAGALIDQEGRYKDAFHAAAEAGQEEVINILFESGYVFPNEPARLVLASLDQGSSYIRESSPSRDEKKNTKSSAALGTLIADFEHSLQTTDSQAVPEASEQQTTYRIRRSRRLYNHHRVEDESYALEVAASRGHLATVKRILDERDHIKLRSYHIGQALWAASKHGFASVVEVITSVEVDFWDFISGSLQRAARQSHLEVIDTLLHCANLQSPSTKKPKQPVGWDFEDPEQEYNRESPVIVSCLCIISLYISANKVQSKYSFESPFCLPIVLSGCQGDQLSSVLRGFELVDPLEKENIRRAALEEAVAFNSTRVLQFLVDEKPLTPEFLAQLMQIAATNGSELAMDILLTSKDAARVLSENFDICLMNSIIGKNDGFVQYLMNQGMPSCSLETLKKALAYSSRVGSLQILSLLGPEVLQCESPSAILAHSLNTACAAGKRDAAEWLINIGADVNATVDAIPSFDDDEEDYDGSDGYEDYDNYDNYYDDDAAINYEGWPRTALQTCFQTLVQAGIRKDIAKRRRKSLDGKVLSQKRRQKRIALQQESVIDLLLEHGANVNQVLGLMKTPLHIAVQKCSLNFVKALISHGADVNYSTPKQGSVLEWAVKRETGSLPIVRALLDAGAIITLQDGKNKEHQSKRSSPVLSAALSFFGESSWRGDGHPFRSSSVEQILSSGPGAVVKLLLLTQPELRATDKHFGVLLKMLAVKSDCDFLGLLIERGVDVNFSGHPYDHALQAAVQHGHLECVRVLLKAGAEVNTPGLIDGVHTSPLLASIVSGHEPIIRELIAYGANVNKSSTEYESPLYCAIVSQSPTITKLLLDSGADISQEPLAMCLAAEAKSFETARILLDVGADVNFSNLANSLPLTTACGNGDMKLATLLIEKGADIMANGTKRTGVGLSTEANATYSYLGKGLPVRIEASALHAACANGHCKVARMLLQNGADPEQSIDNSGTPLAVAAFEGQLEVMELLLQSGSNAYDPLRTLNVLVDAIRGKRLWPTIQFLSERLPDSPDLLPAWEEVLREAYEKLNERLFLFVFWKIPQSVYGLSLAYRFVSESAIEKILSNGLGPDLDLNNGARALRLAAYHQRVNLSSYLVEQGANVQFVSSKYGSPVSAALEGLLAIVSPRRLYYKLIPKKYPLEEMASDLDTKPYKKPLFPNRAGGGFLREKLQCKKLLQILLDAGADVNPQGRPLGPPLHIAAYLGDFSIVQLLVDQGADINASGGYFGSALIAAMASSQQDVFGFLLNRGINLNIRSEMFGSALHYACQYKDCRAVHELLKHHADVKFDGGAFGSPLTKLLSPKDGFGVIDTISWYDSGPEDDYEILDALLQYDYGPEVRDTDLVLAACSFSKKGLLKRLLEYPKSPPVTQDVISAVLTSMEKTNSDYAENLKLLLQHTKGVEIGPKVLNMAKKLETFKTLLQYRPRCQITSEMFEKFAKGGTSMVEIILDQEPSVLPTPAVVMSFLQDAGFSDDHNTLRQLLDRDPDIEITDNMLVAVHLPSHLDLLLSRRPNHPVPDAVLGRILHRVFRAAEVLGVIFKHGPTTKVGPLAMRACLKIRSTETLNLVLQQDPSAVLPSDLPMILVELIRRHGKMDVWKKVDILVQHGKTLDFTPDMRAYIKEQSQLLPEVGLKKMFLRLENRN
jgi:ankyrin repeat protein